MMKPWMRKWVVLVVTGVVVAVIGDALKLSLPGLASPAGPRITGQIIVNEQAGQLRLIDPTGRLAPAGVRLPPHVRTASARRRHDPTTRLISPHTIWWDSRRHLFLGVTNHRASAQLAIKDSAITEYFGDGAPSRVRLTSSTEAFNSVTTSPVADVVAISANTLLPDGARISLLDRDGRQRMITHGSHNPVSWSPDGHMLAYACSVDHGSPQLCTYDLQRGVQRTYVLPGLRNVQTPVFAPDGKTVALVASVAPPLTEALVVVRISDGKPTVLMQDGRRKITPQWSPSGEVLSFATPEAIVLRDVSSGQEKRLAVRSYPVSLQWVSATRQAFGLP